MRGKTRANEKNSIDSLFVEKKTNKINSTNSYTCMYLSFFYILFLSVSQNFQIKNHTIKKKDHKRNYKIVCSPKMKGKIPKMYKY